MKLIFNSKQTFYKMPFGAVAEHTTIAFRVRLSGGKEECSAFEKTGGKVMLIIRNDAGGEVSIACQPAPDGTGDVRHDREPDSAMPHIRWECNTEVLKNAEADNGIKQLKADKVHETILWPAERVAGEGDMVPNPVYVCSWTAENPGLYFYRFAAVLPEGAEATWTAQTEEAQLTVYKEGFSAPDWLSGGLMYQIFPDRFAKSPRYEAPQQSKSYRMHEVWGEVPDSGPDENGIVWNRDFFGGNLKGIEDRLPYLKNLGVTVLYLNPIFRAFSNHRYDTANYMEIDPMLGTEEDFRSLCTSARENGIRIIIDGVFNHTGSHSIYFNKDGAFNTVGAYQSRESPWYGWYSFQSYPEQYDSWWGIDTLPAVNETEESYRDYIVYGEDSVVKHWLRNGASGIRLDVADELPDIFLDELRNAVKETDSGAAVLGEVWEDASNKIAYGQRRRYFQGDQLDSVMNYPLKDGIIQFINGDADGERLRQELLSLMEHYPETCFHSLMNILGTHDTERILTIFLNGSECYEQARQKLFLALLIWAFLPGIPCIYYGDELGMEGGRDPFNRCCFQPEKGKPDITAFYRRLLLFRSRITELGSMELELGPAGRGVFSFLRKGKEGALFVLLNLSGETIDVCLPCKSGYEPLDLVNCGAVYTDPQGSNISGLKVMPKSGVALYSVKKK